MPSFVPRLILPPFIADYRATLYRPSCARIPGSGHLPGGLPNSLTRPNARRSAYGPPHVAVVHDMLAVRFASRISLPRRHAATPPSRCVSAPPLLLSSRRAAAYRSCCFRACPAAAPPLKPLNFVQSAPPIPRRRAAAARRFYTTVTPPRFLPLPLVLCSTLCACCRRLPPRLTPNVAVPRANRRL